jgi:hypothetical protein
MPDSSRRAVLRAAAFVAAAAMAGNAWAQIGGTGKPQVELTQLQVHRAEEGVVLSYDVHFELPRDVEDALYKGVAVVFAARAEVFRERWYWSDKSRAVAERRWRLAYQPLTRRWRVSFDGLSQHYGSLSEALGVLQRSSRWRIMDSNIAADDRSHYVEFSFELDRNELPRPLQIGLSDQNEWTLSVQRRLDIPAAR